ncbi:outer membrane beta-barrel protein [Flavitalea flava]
MSNINSNNIDDLFQRASDKYPLRTDSADWGRLASALDKDPSLIMTAGSGEGDTRRRRRFLWLLLLLPLGGIGFYALQSGSFGPRHSGAMGGLQSKTNSLSRQKVESPSIPEHVAVEESKGNTLTGDKQAIDKQAIDKQAIDKQAIDKQAIVKQEINKQNSTNSNLDPSTQSSQTKTVAAFGKEERDRNPVNRKGNRQQADKSINKNFSAANRTEDNQTEDKAQTKDKAQIDFRRKNALMKGNDKSGVQVSGFENSNIKTAVPMTRVADQLLVNTSAMTLPTLKKEQDAGIKRISKDTVSARSKSIKNRTTGFYAGILVAPELSTVKGQVVKKPGISAGILVGYRLNARLGIETGLYVERKKYYTDGEYFEMKNIPPNYSLLNVNGACTMFEFPIHIRYDLSKGDKMKWFATAGLSTYFMTKESYAYQFMYNGYVHDKSVSYNNLSRYWFSMINLSIGYEQKLGKIGNLRLEPYIRIPTSGVGTGNLPILSAGLNLGITRKF